MTANLQRRDFCARCGFLKEVAHEEDVPRSPPFKGTSALRYCKECFDALRRAGESFIDRVHELEDAARATMTMRRRLQAMFVLGAVVAMGMSFVFFYTVQLSRPCP